MTFSLTMFLLCLTASFALLSFAPSALWASAALLCVWGAFGMLRFGAFERAENYHDTLAALSQQTTAQKILKAFHLDRTAQGRAQIAFMQAHKNIFWISAGVLCIATFGMMVFHVPASGLPENLLTQTDIPDSLKGQPSSSHWPVYLQYGAGALALFAAFACLLSFAADRSARIITGIFSLVWFLCLILLYQAFFPPVLFASGILVFWGLSAALAGRNQPSKTSA